MNYPPEMTTTALKMVLSLLFVLAIVWGLYRFARHSMNSTTGVSNGRLIQVLASHYLGAKKSITMVQVPGAVLVLGISADKVSLLSRIKDPDLISTLHSNERSINRSSFRDHLQRILHPINTGLKPMNSEKKL